MCQYADVGIPSPGRAFVSATRVHLASAAFILATLLARTAPAQEVEIAPASIPAVTAYGYKVSTPGECRVFGLTNAGLYSSMFAGNMHNGEIQFAADVGFLANIGSKSAIGFSLYGSAGQHNMSGGPLLRYRHWLSATRSIDVAVGRDIFGESRGGASILGLVKYNLNEYVGFGIRPEFLGVGYDGCTTFTCETTFERAHRVSLGIEAGRGAGGGILLVAGIVSLVAAFVTLVDLGPDLSMQ